LAQSETAQPLSLFFDRKTHLAKTLLPPRLIPQDRNKAAHTFRPVDHRWLSPSITETPPVAISWPDTVQPLLSKPTPIPQSHDTLNRAGSRFEARVAQQPKSAPSQSRRSAPR